ncbi:MAG: SpoIIE family protein phosphatase [Desulfamplus sp.]|nr:SpoIIE family protein phosphatase [Desulfamplus sp.]
MKILVVEDEVFSRNKLQKIMESFGECEAVENGEDALRAAVSQNPPDLILLDIMMPGMDGYEVCERLKSNPLTKEIPVIFLSAHTEIDEKTKGFEKGAVDFITKPFHKAEAKARVQTHLTLKAMREDLRAKNIVLADQVKEIQEKTEKLRVINEQLARRNKEMVEEQEFAQKVFTNIIDPCFLNTVNIKYLISPMSLFNGDILLVEQNLSGRQVIMLGDFTGHGLRAALGAIPVADIFRTMLAKGFALEEIVSEVNQKLKIILPTGLFFCACFIEIDIIKNRLLVWNGGLPDLLLYREKQGIAARVQSSNPPLGIISPSKFNNSMQILDIKPNDRIYIYSDGLIERENEKHELFGQERIEQCFAENIVPDRLFEELLESVNAFSAGNPQNDDITIIEAFCNFTEYMNKPKPLFKQTGQTDLMRWKVELDIDATVLRNTDPIPILTQFAINIPEFEKHKSYLFTIIQELLTNSIDHGVLYMDSSLKNKPDGFAQYYQTRKKALTALEKGWIKVNMEHVLTEKGGKIILIIKDSGSGFDYTKELLRSNEPNPSIFYGRGINIVRSLCDTLTYFGNGNKVEAVYLLG